MLKPEDILNWGIDVVLWFQQFSPALDLPFESLTFLGNIEFFLILFICVNPKGSLNALTAASVLLGFAPGIILERRWVRFTSGRSVSKRILRFIPGFIVLIGIWMGFRIAFAGMAPVWLFRIVRYALGGWWCAFGAPWLFVRLGLAETE